MEVKKAAMCGECEWNPLSIESICRRTKTGIERIYDHKARGWRRGLDPVFSVLIDHSESSWTGHTVDRAFGDLLRGLKASRISVDLGWEDHCKFEVTITTEDGRRYTSTTYWGSDDYEVCGYTLTGYVDGKEEWTLTDHYTTLGGVIMANGIPRGGD